MILDSGQTNYIAIVIILFQMCEAPK